MRKFLRKTAASILKRYHILAHGGYSVGTAYGGRFLFDWRHSLDKKVAVELYEYEQIRHFQSMLDALAPDIFLDIGAHAALYSIISKSRRPSIEVHAFEPDRTNLCQLYANLFVNKFQTSITVHEHGISDTNGTASFNNSDATSSRGTRRIANDGNTKIEIRRLDDTLDFRKSTIMIKIDVEGHELQVIEGAKSLLGNNNCYLQIEASPENLELLKSELGRLGYRFLQTIGDHYFTNIAGIAPGDD